MTAEVAWLDRLKETRRRQGEASFFYRDAVFKRVAVKVLPGEFYVTREPLLLTTVLGSCVSACMTDRAAGVGGMNHFMLPAGADGSGRYGVFAMEILINELMKAGARRGALEAKVFGGGAVLRAATGSRVGEQNVAFVERFLDQERIPIVSRDVLDVFPRRVAYFPATGKVMVKKLTSESPADVEAERRYAGRANGMAGIGGSVDLF